MEGVFSTEEQEHILGRIDDSDGPDACHEWTGTVDEDGYGRICHQKRKYGVHRLMYFWTYGIDPGDLLVCHSCDNRLCANPKHLWLGTHGDNNSDRDRKGRSRYKYSKEIVDAIRRDYQKGDLPMALSRRYGVSETHTRDIIRGTKRRRGW